jgi:hypothetical protein
MSKSILQKFAKKQDQKDLIFFRNRLCSVKQFVGDGDLYIVEETTTFNSNSTEVVVESSDGNTYRLYCDYYISNGIKMGEIDEDFLMEEELCMPDKYTNKPFFKTNCCVFFENDNFVIKLDKAYDVASWWDFCPIEEPDDERFHNKNFKILCRVIDYIGKDGGFYQNKSDKREFVVTRFEDDPSPVRILCSQELEFQLLNGKNPEDLLENYMSLFVSRNGDEFLRIFDTKSIKPESWHKRTGLLFIIKQVMKNPYKYSFYNLLFDRKNYYKIK